MRQAERAVVARAQIQDRIASRIEGARPLERPSDVHGIPRLLPGHQIQEIDIAVHGRIDYLDQVILCLRPVSHIHMRLFFLRPFAHQRLPGPAGTGPGCPVEGGGPGLLAPQLGDRIPADIRRPKCRRVAEVISPERKDPFRLRVGGALVKINLSR